MAVALAVQDLHRTSGEIDSVDPATVIDRRDVGTGLEVGRYLPPVTLGPVETAVVGDVDGAVRADRSAVGSAETRWVDVGNDRDRTVGGASAQRAAAHLDRENGAVVHRHRTFGKAQATSEDSAVGRG